MTDRNSLFKVNISLLQCPLCGETMYYAETSLKCTRGHDFSLSRKGYCDLASQKHTALYDRSLFESRRRILRSGLYDQAIDTLRSLLSQYAPEGPVLDAGCGEGTFLLRLADGKRPYFGADLAREGIRLAASGANGLGWAVADLARLPFRSQTVGAVLNILSPAAYPEFRRVLRQDGVLIKVVPGDRYLNEIRELTGKQPHSNEKVTALFDRHFRRVDTVEIENTFPLSEAQARDLFLMTPLTEHTELTAQILSSLRCITVHLCILVGKCD